MNNQAVAAHAKQKWANTYNWTRPIWSGSNVSLSGNSGGEWSGYNVNSCQAVPQAKIINDTNTLPKITHRRKYDYDKDDMKNAMEEIVNNHVTVTQVAQKYKIPRTTLYQRISKLKSDVSFNQNQGIENVNIRKYVFNETPYFRRLLSPDQVKKI